MKDRITALTMSVEMHLRIPWSREMDIPKVNFPVPVHPPTRTSLGLSRFTFSDTTNSRVLILDHASA